jgi:recombination protein RecR
MSNVGEPEAMKRAVAQLSRLSGLGPSLARRLVFEMIQRPGENNVDLIASLQSVFEEVTTCPVCGALASKEGCPVCSDANRIQNIICVVEEPRDVLAIERSRGYHGLYHVLGGTLSPLEGRGPEELRIAALEARLKEGDFLEIILATDPDMEGDATAQYLSRILKPYGIKTTRIARGLPVGGNLEFVDQSTLAEALEGRVEVI